MLPNRSSSLKDHPKSSSSSSSSSYSGVKRKGRGGGGGGEEKVPWGLYHSTAAGTALIKTLNTLVEEEGMSVETATQILDNFDKELLNNFRDEMSSHPPIVANVNGKVLNYNCCRSDWRIDVEDVTVQVGTETIPAENGRILFRMKEK